MGVVRFLSSLTFRGVLPGVCEALGVEAAKAGPEIVFAVLSTRFRDHSQRITEALQESVNRSWSALEVALAGDSWWKRVKSTLGRSEDQVFAGQVRAFLDAAPLPELTGKDSFRLACLDDLKAARKKGLLTHVPDGGDLFTRYLDPKSLLNSELEVMADVAALLKEAGHANLAHLLSLQAAQGQSLLVVAVRYFFRRAVEEDDRLSRGLTFTQLDQLQASQQAAFAGLHIVLGTHSQRLEELLGGLQEQLAETHDAVLDVQAELGRQGTQNRDIYQAVLDLQRHLDLMHREVRPRDSLSIRSDHERELVRQVIERYRALPEGQRERMPALLNAVGKLEVAAGDFEAAQEDFAAVATIVTDAQSRGEAHFNSYRAALERRDWKIAHRELLEAIRVDAKRYAPFPVGKYQPQRILGAGGFGVAFLCRHKELGADVVVKTLIGDDLDRDVDQVFAEAKALWQLDHPGIIRLLDCGYTFPATKARPYFVMHYFDGQPLDEYVQRHGPLLIDEIAEVARQMAQGLQAAHGKGILHRDVKPANVLVRKQNGDWHVKLIDFGLALSQRAMTNAATFQKTRTIFSASIAGTLEYAAPEQMGKLTGAKIGPPADVYGLAKTCCYALFETAEPTFHDWKRLRPGWAELLGDCLNRSPDRRPADMRRLLDRLKDLQDDRSPPPPKPVPVLAPAPILMLTPAPVPILAPAPVEELEAPIRALLKKYASEANLLVEPAIAEQKIANARAGCKIPGDETVLGLIDCTVFGSGSDAVVFGARGIYYHNMGNSAPDPGCLSYSDFPQCHFAKYWMFCVRTRGDEYLNLSGSNANRGKVIELLTAIKDAVLKARSRSVPSALLPERILKLLKRQVNRGGFYVSPDIPLKKLNNATRSCAIPADEKVLGLIDCTTFGSGSDALVFGSHGFYYHNKAGNVPDPGYVSYSEFPHLLFGTTWLNCVTLGHDRYCNRGGSTVTREKVIEMLEAVKQVVIEVGAS